MEFGRNNQFWSDKSGKSFPARADLRQRWVGLTWGTGTRSRLIPRANLSRVRFLRFLSGNLVKFRQRWFLKKSSRKNLIQVKCPLLVFPKDTVYWQKRRMEVHLRSAADQVKSMRQAEDRATQRDKGRRTAKESRTKIVALQAWAVWLKI